MNKIFKGSSRFLKNNSATILTVVGAVGVVGTAISTAKATTKVSRLLDEATEYKGAELTINEKIRLAAPIYIPSVLLGTATITCIFGANFLNKRKQASLIGAYTMLDSSYKTYKAKVKAMYGEEGHEKITEEIAKDDMKSSLRRYEPEKELFYDVYSGRYFENTMENVLAAENELNKVLHTDWGVGLNEFYKYVGLEELPEYHAVGWTAPAMTDMYWHSWIEFDHKKAILDDGLECIILDFPLAPIIDYLEY